MARRRKKRAPTPPPGLERDIHNLKVAMAAEKKDALVARASALGIDDASALTKAALMSAIVAAVRAAADAAAAAAPPPPLPPPCGLSYAEQLERLGGVAHGVLMEHIVKRGVGPCVALEHVDGPAATRIVAWMEHRATWPDLISALPDELLVYICSFLRIGDLVALSLVSRTFCRVARDNVLLRCHAARFFARVEAPIAIADVNLGAPGSVMDAIRAVAATLCVLCNERTGDVAEGWGPDLVCKACVDRIMWSPVIGQAWVSVAKCKSVFGLRPKHWAPLKPSKRVGISVSRGSKDVHALLVADVLPIVCAVHGSVAAAILKTRKAKASPRPSRAKLRANEAKGDLRAAGIWAFPRYTHDSLVWSGAPDDPPPPGLAPVHPRACAIIDAFIHEDDGCEPEIGTVLRAIFAPVSTAAAVSLVAAADADAGPLATAWLAEPRLCFDSLLLSAYANASGGCGTAWIDAVLTTGRARADRLAALAARLPDARIGLALSLTNFVVKGAVGQRAQGRTIRTIDDVVGAVM